jgi:type II secretory pathway pseudopilin PulG
MRLDTSAVGAVMHEHHSHAARARPMKLFPTIKSLRRGNISAFTLVEMMVAFWVYVILLVSAMVAIQIFGMRIYTLTATKLSATENSRKALNQIRDEIREAKMLQVGNCNNTGAFSFTAFPGTNAATGNALQAYATTNQVAPYIIYYLQTNVSTSVFSSNNLMMCSVTAAGTNITILASYITNNIIFDAEDYQGNIVSNNMKNNQVYHVTLQFYQWEFPIGSIVSAGGYYDYYQLRTKVCRRATD